MLVMGHCLTDGIGCFLLIMAVFLLAKAVVGQLKVAGLFIKHLIGSALHCTTC